MSMMRDLVKQLDEKRADARLMGGEDKVERQHSRGKMDVRQRIDALFDPGTFLEMGMHAVDHKIDRTPAAHRAPGDGVITGTGHIIGRVGTSIPRHGGVVAAASQPIFSVACVHISIRKQTVE